MYRGNAFSYSSTKLYQGLNTDTPNMSPVKQNSGLWYHLNMHGQRLCGLKSPIIMSVESSRYDYGVGEQWKLWQDCADMQACLICFHVNQAPFFCQLTFWPSQYCLLVTFLINASTHYTLPKLLTSERFQPDNATLLGSRQEGAFDDNLRIFQPKFMLWVLIRQF